MGGEKKIDEDKRIKEYRKKWRAKNCEKLKISNYEYNKKNYKKWYDKRQLRIKRIKGFIENIRKEIQIINDLCNEYGI